MDMPTVEELTARFAVACDLKHPIDRDRITECLMRWIGGVSKHPVRLRFVDDYEQMVKDGTAAWDARDVRAAWDAWAVRDAWDAWAARAVRAARAARTAWDVRDAWDAAFEVSWISITAIGAASLNDEKAYSTRLPVLEAFEAGAYAFWVLPDEIVVATLPQVVAVDDRRRLHADGAPAFSWLGVDDYWHHGVLMPTEEAKDHTKITVARIDAEQNAEVRRVLIGWFGTERYVREFGAVIVHEDLDAVGNPRRLFRRDVKDDEPIVMVEVTDSTPLPNGERKNYMLRVDPNAYGGRAAKECHAAIASTWRKKADHSVLMFDRPENYRPIIET